MLAEQTSSRVGTVPGDIAPRPGVALCQAHFDGIPTDDHDDRNLGGGTHGRHCVPRDEGDDQIDLLCNEVACGRVCSARVSRHKPTFKYEFAPFNPAMLPEALDEWCHVNRHIYRRQDADSVDPARPLRLCRERRKKAESEHDREPDPPQWAPRVGMAGGSLADLNYGRFAVPLP